MNNIRITFLRDDRYQPVGCIAINIDTGSADVLYGVSVKNPADRFDRKMGRRYAIGTMVEAPFVVQLPHNGGELTMHEITRHVMQDIVRLPSQVPSRAVKAARLWLRHDKENSQSVIH